MMDLKLAKRLFGLMAMSCYTRIENLSKQEQKELKELLSEIETSEFVLDEENKLRDYVLWILQLIENDSECVHEKIQTILQLNLF